MRFPAPLFLWPLLLLLPSCRTDRLAVRRTPAAESEAGDAARFLAGIPGRGVSPFKLLETEAAWQDHLHRLDALFAEFHSRRLPAMRAFTASELSAPADASCPVFYPFSGADALTMLTFFPGRKTYVMAALEPPGRVPHPSDFPASTLSSALPPVASTLESLLTKSFFVTKEMDRQLRGQATDGVTEPILILLARLGYDVTAYSYIQLDDSGRAIGRHQDVRRAAFGLSRGVRFRIRPRTGEAEATLYYISLNLDDRHMRANRAFPRFLQSLGPTCTLLKATSYMLHDKSFSLIRSLILDRSALILQDDSGIPYRYLAQGGWHVQLYGSYVKPYGKVFEFRTQPDLHAAYGDPNHKPRPLGFRIGYGAGRVTSNLQIARKPAARG